MNDIADGLIQKRLDSFDGFRLFKEYGIVADTADQLDDHIDHQLLIYKLMAGGTEKLGILMIDRVFVPCRTGGQCIFEDSPAQMLGDEDQKRMVLLKTVQNVVNDGNDSLLKFPCRYAVCFQKSVLKDERCPGRDQPVADIVLIFKIQIKCALGDTRLFYNIGDGCLRETFDCEQLKGSIQKGISFFLFFFGYFSYVASPGKTIKNL